MRTKYCHRPFLLSGSLMQVVASMAAMFLVLSCANGTWAQGTLVYSFESPEINPDGFGPNGGGTTISQDTIGATEGVSSMKVEIVAGATFVGALTPMVAPEIGDPPGMNFVIFDLTITEPFPNELGDFVDGGITIFGASQPGPGQQFGLQAQFEDDQVSFGDLAVGTHEIRIDLTEATHPETFVVGTFNEIFGVEGSGPNDIIPTGFQIYINKSNTAPWTGYIDNVRVGMSAPGGDADFNDSGFVEGQDFLIWQRGFGSSGGQPQGNADGMGAIDGADFAIWKAQFGNPSVATSAAAGVPEPATSVLGLAALSAVAWARRRRVRAG